MEKPMRRITVFVSIFVLVFLIFSATRDTLASFAWQKYRSAPFALALVRDDAEIAMNIGDYFFGGGGYNLGLSEQAYQKALVVAPGILWGHYQIARIRFVRGEYELALKEIEGELLSNPANLRSLYVRGLIYAYRGAPGDLLLAENDFMQFIAWAPTEWAGYNDLAWIFIREEKYGQAIEAVDKAFANAHGAEENPWLWNMKGVAELNLEKYGRAEVSFSRASALALALHEAEWRKAYPGNASADATEGLKQFRDSITKNLEKTRLELVAK